jgi:hypothetical protein
MNKSNFVCASVLLMSILSQSCDSNSNKATANQPPTQPTPSKQVPIQQTTTEQPAPEQEPAEMDAAEQASSEEKVAEQDAPKLAVSEDVAPDDDVKQSKLELLDLLQKMKASAIAQEDQEKAASLDQEIEQVVSDLNEIEKSRKLQAEAAKTSETADNTENNNELAAPQVEQAATEAPEEKPAPVELPEATPEPVHDSPFEKDIARLVKIRDNEKAQALLPIQKRFDLGTQALLRKVTQSGNLDAAIKLKAVIENPESITSFAQEAQTIHDKELLRLVSLRDKETAAAMVPIQKRFDLAAQQLLRKATQSGDLDAAIKLKAMIEEVTNSSNPAPVVSANASIAAKPTPVASNSTSNLKDSPEKDFEVSYSEDGYGIIKYQGRARQVRIPAMIQGGPVVSVGRSAFFGSTSVEEVVLPESIRYLSATSFHGATNLKKINIPKSVIGLDAPFRGCALKELNIPAGVQNIHHLTAWCLNLEKINVDPNNENYASVDGVLYNKQITELLNIPAGLKKQFLRVPNSVTTIAARCMEGSKLKTLQIPKETRIAEDAFISADDVKVSRY